MRIVANIVQSLGDKCDEKVIEFAKQLGIHIER